MHGFLDYVRKYLGPSRPSLSFFFFFLHRTLCQGSSGTTEGDISLSSSQTGLEWDSAIALYGHIPALAADYGHRGKWSDKAASRGLPKRFI